MPILRLLEQLPLEPEEVAGLLCAYQQTLHALGLVDRTDPIVELVARKVIEIGGTGVRDPAEIAILAVKDLGSA